MDRKPANQTKKSFYEFKNFQNELSYMNIATFADGILAKVSPSNGNSSLF